MTLLVEVLGFVVLAGALRTLLPAGALPLAGALTALAVAIGGAALWLDGYPTVRKLLAEHASSEVLTRAQANAAAGGLFPADEGFLAWADARLPKTATVWLECAGHCPGEWVTFRLSPRVFVSSPSQAQFALFYDVAPSSAAYARGKPLAIFAPANSSGDANFVSGQEAIATLRP
jgi:hypothetical protein